jgi:hypothetical protein
MVDLRVWDELNWLRNGSKNHTTCDQVQSTSVKLASASPLEYHNTPDTGLEKQRLALAELRLSTDFDKTEALETFTLTVPHIIMEAIEVVKH